MNNLERWEIIAEQELRLKVLKSYSLMEELSHKNTDSNYLFGVADCMRVLAKEFSIGEEM